MSKYLATDLDGTLLEPKSVNKFVCNENLIATEKFNKNVFIVSGRNPQFIESVCDELNINHTFISCNGGMIFVNKKRIFTSFIENEILLEIIDYVKENHKNYHIIFIHQNGTLYSLYDNEKRVLEHEKKAMSAHPKLAYITNKNTDELYSILNANNSIVKMNLNIDETSKYAIFEYLKQKNYNISVSICNNSLEITYKGINKGSSLKILTDYLNINPEDVYVIGDDGNDVWMFKEYSNSFLVKNSQNKHLLNIAKHDLDYFKDIVNYMEE